MERIHSRADLIALADKLGVRADWHEPDEQQVTARFYGDSFDNACGPWGDEHEMHVVLVRTNDHGEAVEDIARINLAMLLAWATGFES